MKKVCRDQKKCSRRKKYSDNIAYDIFLSYLCTTLKGMMVYMRYEHLIFGRYCGFEVQNYNK